MFRFLTFAVFILVASTVRRSSATLGADAESLMKITRALCTGGHDDNFAKQFYDCYFQLPMNEKCLFDKCQKNTWGFVLNTIQNIETICRPPSALPMYTQCLRSEFQICQKDVAKAVTTINICQGQLLGIE